MLNMRNILIWGEELVPILISPLCFMLTEQLYTRCTYGYTIYNGANLSKFDMKLYVQYSHPIPAGVMPTV